jgi:Ni/Co efflux regulator RcnB
MAACLLEEAMKPISSLLVVLSVLCLALPAQAEKPEWAGQGGGKGHGKPDKHQSERQNDWQGDRRGGRDRDDHDGGDRPRHGGRNDGPSVAVQGGSGNVQIGVYFGAPQRQVLYDYYRPQFHGAKCPPGLAKKGNGCMPPGQAKKWRVGQPLPRDVVYYPVPNEVSVRIGLPPPGYKYVRVAADILMIAVGTGMVIDAVDDLLR